jgi:AcrR family transcriptional regulator
MPFCSRCGSDDVEGVMTSPVINLVMTLSVVKDGRQCHRGGYARQMSRWPADARVRLEQAALDLFAERGFAETTVPQITARAGLTTRTFFRHFTDKREVLFAYDAQIPVFVAEVLSDAPASCTPMEVLAHGLHGIGAKFEPEREYLRVRRSIVETDESLRERELRKLATLSEAIRQGFLERGTDELTSTLAAHLAAGVFTVGLNRWLDRDGGPPLRNVLRDTLAAAANLVANPTPAHSGEGR